MSVNGKPTSQEELDAWRLYIKMATYKDLMIPALESKIYTSSKPPKIIKLAKELVKSEDYDNLLIAEQILKDESRGD